jgi:hypothetical protein
VVTLTENGGNALIGSTAPRERPTDMSAQAENRRSKNVETGRGEIARVTQHDRIATVKAANARTGLRIIGSAAEFRYRMSSASA